MAEQAVQVYQEVHGFSSEQETMLQEKLHESHVKQRPGAHGKKLSYVSGDYAIATANRIFGFGKWGYRVVSKSHETVGEKDYYTADIELCVIGCPFPFPGEGVGVPRDNTIEQHEKARKEAVTDALKRALRHFGDQFGLSLYDEDNYIEATDGSDKRVGDVGKPAPRVVDATPAQSRDEALHDLAKPGPARAGKPLTNGDGSEAKPKAYSLEEVKAFFLKMFKPEKWEAFKIGVIGVQVDDEGLDDAELSRLYSKLVEIKRDKMTAATNAILR